MLPLASGIAARILCNPPVKTPAAPAAIISKKVLRLISGKICCRDQFSTSWDVGAAFLRPVKGVAPTELYALNSHMFAKGRTPPWWVTPQRCEGGSTINWL
jgi:hypothetical protein